MRRWKGAIMQELGPPQERADRFLATDYMMHLVRCKVNCRQCCSSILDCSRFLWFCVPQTYSSPEEAQRRLAMFVALTFDFKSQAQLVTLLPAPISLDPKDPASIPGMGLTDAALKLGTLTELVQDVLPKNSPLWPYIMDFLAPEVSIAYCLRSQYLTQVLNINIFHAMYIHYFQDLSWHPGLCFSISEPAKLRDTFLLWLTTGFGGAKDWLLSCITSSSSYENAATLKTCSTSEDEASVTVHEKIDGFLIYWCRGCKKGSSNGGNAVNVKYSLLPSSP